MPSTYKLIWSARASQNLADILDYLERRWSEREIRNFVRLLDQRLQLICQQPTLYPSSIQKQGLRRSVLTRQTTIYYQIVEQEIRIITLFDNRQRPESLG